MFGQETGGRGWGMNTERRLKGSRKGTSLIKYRPGIMRLSFCSFDASHYLEQPSIHPSFYHLTCFIPTVVMGVILGEDQQCTSLYVHLSRYPPKWFTLYSWLTLFPRDSSTSTSKEEGKRKEVFHLMGLYTNQLTKEKIINTTKFKAPKVFGHPHSLNKGRV